MTSMTHRASALDFLARSTINVDDNSCYPAAPDLIFEADIRDQEDGESQIILFIKDDLGRMQHRVRMNRTSARDLIVVLQKSLRDGKGG
ncbi:MAG: hypothetical protein EOM02_05340 [Synergistales bacterium]|nr:hypothetical protein [Dethiosulfovibrio sp.]NCC96248.1 hypothetical protein [Synergistales bacterium]